MSSESTSEPGEQETASRAKGLQLSFGRSPELLQCLRCEPPGQRRSRASSSKIQPGLACQSGHTKLAGDESASEVTTEPEDSPETIRIEKAEKDWAERPKKKRKAAAPHSSSDCEETGQPNPGFRSSCCTDFVSYMLGNVLSTTELQKLRSREVHFAEFCAGMGTGSQSLVARFALSLCV